MSWTVDGVAEHESIIKHSVFRTRICNVSDEESAMEFLSQVSDPEATHNCWAFKTGSRYRVSDDGEPSGTAGRPILSAIEGQDFDHVMVVVTRWFGGVKLGAGGLVRAYGGAASACLREAVKIELIERIGLKFHCPFSLYAEVEAKLPHWQVEVKSCEFDSCGAALNVSLPLIHKEKLADWLRNLTRGQKQLQFQDEGDL